MTMDIRALHGSDFENRRILVTGGAGFIGSHLVEALVTLGADVVALDDLSGGDWANLDGLGDSVNQITGSILDRKLLAEAVAGCDVIFHEAALGSVPRSVEQPVRYHEVNVLGTVNVLQAACEAGVRRVVFAGSSSAYGDPPNPDAAKVETQRPSALSPYSASKLAGEYAFQCFANCYDIDTAVLRYFNVFGPRQNANSAYAAVIAAFAKALLGGQRAKIYGDGEQSRDFTFVHNVVHANLLAAKCPEPLKGRIFNSACGQRITVNQLYHRMAELLDRAGQEPDYQPARAGDVRHSLADITRAQQVLGYQPQVPFEHGLAETIRWYRGVLV